MGGALEVGYLDSSSTSIAWVALWKWV
eukprot:COSAG05_NODE_28514_length_123_cov_8.000000_1_plen_26_part_10